MNNGKYYTPEYKKKQDEKIDRLFGPIQEHTKICLCCNSEFVFKGRMQTKKYNEAKFCSRSCANNRQTWWNNNSTQYRTIALRHNDHICVVCGFDKIVAIHHIDENKNNNHPSNLIPLCPNHHGMVHSRWKNEVIPFIIEWQKQWAVGIDGNTEALHASIPGSIPGRSTIIS
jgi:hypothetical protein